MQSGRIKFIHDEKDFGYITVQGKTDVYFHLSRLRIPSDQDVATLGVDVVFDEEPDPKRPDSSRANNVQIVSADGDEKLRARIQKYVTAARSPRVQKEFDLSQSYYGTIQKVDERGFGFIKLTSKDFIFFHASSFKVPLHSGSDKIGVGVRCKLGPDEKRGGFRAVEVEIVDESGDEETKRKIQSMISSRRERLRVGAEKAEEFRSRQDAKEAARGGGDVRPEYERSMRARQIHKLFHKKEKATTTG